MISSSSTMSTDPFLAMRLSVLSAKVSGPRIGAVSLGENRTKKKARACKEIRGQRSEVKNQKQKSAVEKTCSFEICDLCSLTSDLRLLTSVFCSSRQPTAIESARGQLA